MKIFVSGLPGVGKTTLIYEIVKEFKNKIKISGFLTFSILSNNRRVGFKIFDISSQKEFVFAHEKIKGIKFGKYFVNISALEKEIQKLEKEIDESDLIVIDEIGKMEMLNQKFMSFVSQLIKGEKNLLCTLHRKFINSYKSFGKFYWLTKENKEKIKAEIIKELENFVKL